MCEEVQYSWERVNDDACTEIATAVGDYAGRLREDGGQRRTDFGCDLDGSGERECGFHPGSAASCGLRRLDGVYNIGLCARVFHSNSRWDDYLVFATWVAGAATWKGSSSKWRLVCVAVPD